MPHCPVIFQTACKVLIGPATRRPQFQCVVGIGRASSALIMAYVEVALHLMAWLAGHVAIKLGRVPSVLNTVNLVCTFSFDLYLLRQCTDLRFEMNTTGRTAPTFPARAQVSGPANDIKSQKRAYSAAMPTTLARTVAVVQTKATLIFSA